MPLAVHAADAMSPLKVRVVGADACINTLAAVVFKTELSRAANIAPPQILFERELDEIGVVADAVVAFDVLAVCVHVMLQFLPTI